MRNLPRTGSLWPRLVEFAARADHAHGLEEAGLRLVPLETVHLFQATPAHSVTFASTGSGGVHFGFLPLPDTTLDRSPIVVTVPLAREPNHVVAGSLAEFLDLGCRQGWSYLDQLAFDRVWAANWYASRNPPLFAVLERLSRVFGLAPWPAVSSRLTELERTYRDALCAHEPLVAADA